MPDIAGPPNRQTSSCPLRRLSSAELLTRQGQIRQFIASARTYYPLAARNLEWWLNQAGARRDVLLSEFDFRNPDCGLPRFLMDTHRKVIALGSRSGVAGVPAGALGIEGRLRLPASDPNSLQSGRNQTLDWEDSVRADFLADTASYTAPVPELDLSIALGGYTVHSRVTVRAQPSVEQRQLIEVVSWQVQVCDYYNWIVAPKMIPHVKIPVCISAEAPIPIPAGVSIPTVPPDAGRVVTAFGYTVVFFKDQWLAEVEAAGGARPFDLYSEVFDAPADVRANFEAVNGMIRI